MKIAPSSVFAVLSASIAFRIFYILVSAVITLFLSAYLGIEHFGLYTWLVGIALLLSGLAQAGGGALVVRETAQSSGRAAPVRILGQTAVLSAGLLVALSAIALVLALAHDRVIAPPVLVSLLLLALANLALVLVGASLRGLGLLQRGQLPELALRPALFLALLGGAVLTGRALGPEAAIWLLIAAYLTALAVAGRFLLAGLAARPETPAGLAVPGRGASFLRLALVGWLAVTNTHLLVILTGLLADYAEVGLYRLAAQVALVMALGLTAIETVQAPAYARSHKEGDQRALHGLLQLSCRLGLALSAAVMVVLVVFGRPLLAIPLGTEVAEGVYPALCLLAAAQLLNATTGNVGVLMIAARQERRLILGNLAALATTLLAAWLLIPQYGAIAAAAAHGLGLSVRNLVNLWFCWRVLGIIALPFAPYRGHPAGEAMP